MTISNLMKMVRVLQTGRKHRGKRRIYCYKQFLLFPQCFSKDVHCRLVKPGLVWETSKGLSFLVYKSVKDIVEKQENAHNRHFIIFLTVFCIPSRID